MSPSPLDQILRLPRANRWACDFLFSPPPTYHSDITLPPPAFSHALSFACRRFVSPYQVRNDFFVISVPVLILDDILIGYSFCLPMTTSQPREDPFDPPWSARFAFDVNAKELFHVIVEHPQHGYGLYWIRFDSQMGAQAVVVVPAAEYSFANLPHVVLSAFTVSERKLLEAPKQTIDNTPQPEDLATFIDNILDPPQEPSHLPLTNILESSQYGASTYMQPSHAYSPLDNSIVQLFNLSIGEFRSAHVHSDPVYMPAEPTTLMRKVVYASKSEFDVLQKAFCDSYFGAVLSIAPDQLLLESGEEQQSSDVSFNDAIPYVAVVEELDSICEDDLCVSLPPETNPKRKPLTAVPIAPAKQYEQLQCSDESVEEQKARTLQERKRRNRLSAARSNDRRRKRMEAMQRGIAENKKRVEVLREVEGVLKAEKEQLESILKRVREQA